MHPTLVLEQDQYWLDADGLKLVRLPLAFRERLEGYAGRSVIFGVRPEDVATPAPGEANDRGNLLTARADVVETLGAEMFVYLTCGPHSIVARMESSERPLTVGQNLEVALKMAQTHLFEKETSQTIV